MVTSRQQKRIATLAAAIQRAEEKREECIAALVRAELRLRNLRGASGRAQARAAKADTPEKRKFARTWNEGPEVQFNDKIPNLGE